jgi:hypothetical protein
LKIRTIFSIFRSSPIARRCSSPDPDRWRSEQGIDLPAEQLAVKLFGAGDIVRRKFKPDDAGRNLAGFPDFTHVLAFACGAYFTLSEMRRTSKRIQDRSGGIFQIVADE